MKTVIDERIAEQLAGTGHFYVMHRFDLDNVAFARSMRAKGLYVSISVGVKEADRAAVDALASEGTGADYITIDIAHGHADAHTHGASVHAETHSEPVDSHHGHGHHGHHGHHHHHPHRTPQSHHCPKHLPRHLRLHAPCHLP